MGAACLRMAEPLRQLLQHLMLWVGGLPLPAVGSNAVVFLSSQDSFTNFGSSFHLFLIKYHRLPYETS